MSAKTNAVTLKYYGHATMGLHTQDTSLIIDPFLAPNSHVTTVTADEIEADYILITHGHFDHLSDAMPIAQRTGATVICNFEIGNWFQSAGIKKCHQMHIGGGYDFPFGRVKMTIAHHGSALPDGSNGGNPGGYLIYFNDGPSVYIAGDTALTYDMKLIGDAGGVDLAVLPIGDNFTMGPDDAIRAAQFVQAKHVLPVHYDTFPPIVQDPVAFAQKLQAEAGIGCTVLESGGKLTL